MDGRFARSQRAIGESSNLAQLAMSYYWTKYANDELDTKEAKDLYDIFVILSVAAQCSIDSIKRVYEIDTLEEIERIKKMQCMIFTDEEGNRKDYPLFMKYTKDVQVTKNGKEVEISKITKDRNKISNRINSEIICPMNWLQEWLDKVQGTKRVNAIPTEDFFISMVGRANNRQVTKAVLYAKQYQDFITANINRLSDYDFVDKFNEKTEEFYNNIAGMKISSQITINRIIEIALGISNIKKSKKLNAQKYCVRILNALYRANPQKFLINFA